MRFPLFILAVSLALVGPDHASAAEKPNIVLILSDDQAWTDYGFMGHEEIKTPQLDKLAANSVVFERGYVAAPLCRPSLASMYSWNRSPSISPNVSGSPTHPRSPARAETRSCLTWEARELA